MHLTAKQSPDRELYIQHDQSCSTRSSNWRVVEKLINGGASAVGLPGGLLVTRQIEQEEPTLLSTQAAIRRLSNVRSAAGLLGQPFLLLACTHARGAQALAFDDDRRDWRCLSGQRTQDGSHVYCGGMTAAIDRSLAYAPHADVLCYSASSFEITEALGFLNEVTRRFPEKQCAFCFDSIGADVARPAFDLAATQQKVLRAGFSYLFFHQAGSMVFPGSPVDLPWAIVEDRPDRSIAGAPGVWNPSDLDSRRCRER